MLTLSFLRSSQASSQACIWRAQIPKSVSLFSKSLQFPHKRRHFVSRLGPSWAPGVGLRKVDGNPWVQFSDFPLNTFWGHISHNSPALCLVSPDQELNDSGFQRNKPPVSWSAENFLVVWSKEGNWSSSYPLFDFQLILLLIPAILFLLSCSGLTLECVCRSGWLASKSNSFHRPWSCNCPYPPFRPPQTSQHLLFSANFSSMLLILKTRHVCDQSVIFKGSPDYFLRQYLKL